MVALWYHSLDLEVSWEMLFSVFETGQGRYQPDPNFTYSDGHPGYTLDQRRLAFWVGVVALGLPIVMLIGVITGACLYDSISHFYYAQFLGGIFIAALVFIGTFLLAYRGENENESRLATIAGIGALFVALFPTNGRGCDLDEFSGRALADFTLEDAANFVNVIPASEDNPFFELFRGSEIIHGTSAVLLFAFLAWYSFFVFTRVIDKIHLDDDGKLTSQKRNRNRIYRISGTVIVASMFAIVIGHFLLRGGWNDYNLTFWFESFALWAFGVSWMVKGQFFGDALLDK